MPPLREIPIPPPWLEVARAYAGLKEAPGDADNPVILGWAAKLGGWVKSFFTKDSIPWCTLFVSHCLSEAGFKPLPSLASLDYLKWGQPLDAPCRGAILVFQRPGGGHIGFYEGETATDYRVFGGNQSDQVGLTWIAKTRLRGIRWPAEALPPAAAPVLLTPTGEPRSTNEI